MADATISQESLVKILDIEHVVEPESQKHPEIQGQGDKVLEDWELPKFRSKLRERIQEEIMKTGSQVPKTGDYLEDFVFKRAKSKKEYVDLIAGVLIYVAEFNNRQLKGEEKEMCVKDEDSKSVDPES